jgi:hypothetical protein
MSTLSASGFKNDPDDAISLKRWCSVLRLGLTGENLYNAKFNNLLETDFEALKLLRGNHRATALKAVMGLCLFWSLCNPGRCTRKTSND